MSESNNIRVGVIGLGMGRGHVQQYQKATGCDVVALCDMNAALLEQRAAELGVEQTYTDTDALLSSGSVDAVSVATPNKFHAPLTIQALEAGLHVLCEKPMAMSAAEAQTMIDAATKADRKLGIHFNHRMLPPVQLLARHVEAGDLGEVYFARTVWHRRKGIPARPSFLDKANSGGGAMIDLGVHMLDMTLYLMGYPAVHSVTAAAHTRFDQKDVPDIDMTVDDFATAYLRLDGGATLALEISWASHHDHPEQRLVQLYGTEGGARWLSNHYQNTELAIHHRQHGTLATTRFDQDPADAGSVQQDFINAIRDDRDPLCSAAHGLTTMKVLDAIYESTRTGKEVTL